jgi:hypothetical protein
MEKTLLDQLEEVFQKGFIEKDIDLYGKTWTMRTLNDQESVWRDQFIKLVVSSSFISERRVPTLAVAIKKIDGKSILSIFGGAEERPKMSAQEEMAKAITGITDEIPELIAAKKFKIWLDRQPSFVAEALYSKFQELEAEARELVNGVFSGDNFRGPTAEGTTQPENKAGGSNGDGGVADGGKS